MSNSRYLCLSVFCTSCNRSMSLRKIFDTATQIEGFEVEEYISNKFGFLENFWDGAVCIHPNSSTRKELIALLAGLPNELLKHEVKRDEDRQIERFYITLSSASDNRSHRRKMRRYNRNPIFKRG